MKKLVMTLALALTLLSVNAVPAKPGTVKVKMANGNMVDATIVGDEYWHCMVDEAGDVITENDNGLYEKSNVSLRDIDVKQAWKWHKKAAEQASLDE